MPAVGGEVSDLELVAAGRLETVSLPALGPWVMFSSGISRMWVIDPGGDSYELERLINCTTADRTWGIAVTPDIYTSLLLNYYTYVCTLKNNALPLPVLISYICTELLARRSPNKHI